MVKPSGTERTTEERAWSMLGAMLVSGEGESAGVRSGTSSSVGARDGSARTSSSTACNLALKSSSADSASSSVMLPRCTRVSV